MIFAFEIFLTCIMLALIYDYHLYAKRKRKMRASLNLDNMLWRNYFESYRAQKPRDQHNLG